MCSGTSVPKANVPEKCGKKVEPIMVSAYFKSSGKCLFTKCFGVAKPLQNYNLIPRIQPRKI